MDSEASPSTMRKDASTSSASAPASLPSPPSSSRAAGPSPSSSAAPAAKVWKPVAAGTAPRIPELPDSYYTPSANQLRMAHASQTNKLKALGVDTNFTTRKQREAEAKARELKRINRWPTTIIRIRFPDRHQIETTLPSSAHLKDIYDFVKLSLADEWQKEPFLLYVPPRQELKLDDASLNSKTLLDLQLAPSSVLMIRFTKAPSLNDSTRTAPLRAELLSIAQELPAPPSFDPTAESGGKEEGTADVEGEGDEQESRGKTLMSSSKGGTKVPKWLKSVSKK